MTDFPRPLLHIYGEMGGVIQAAYIGRWMDIEHLAAPPCDLSPTDVARPDGALHAFRPGWAEDAPALMCLARLFLTVCAPAAALAEPSTRHTFLVRLYALASFHSAQRAATPAALQEYQAANKYLFMAWNSGESRHLGRILASQRGGTHSVLSEYALGLARLLSNPPAPGALSNALQHMSGYFSDSTSIAEKSAFENALADLRQGRAGTEPALAILRGWQARTPHPYIARQTLLAPYPPALADVGLAPS
jgi:uncharacterized protein YbgA (DUF1722 family)